MIKNLILTSILIFGLTSCASDSEDDLTNVNNPSSGSTYNNSIETIVNQSCATTGCHNATTKQSGIDLSTYELAKTGFAGRAWIRTNAGTMPPVGKLPDATIDKINNWIQNNFPN